MHYDVGVQAKFTAVLKRIDENFFDQDKPPSEMVQESRTPSSGDPRTGPCL